MFQAQHLQAFEDALKAAGDTGDGATKHGKTFGDGIPDVCVSLLPEKNVRRSDVFRLAKDSEANTITVCAAIMAWGGMHGNSRKSFFVDGCQEWRRVAEEIRAGRLSRKDAYEQLRLLRSQGKLTGAGPAYFTKLIYFLMPGSGQAFRPGYIMDQWAGCSINLLQGEELVLMDVTRTWTSPNGSTRTRPNAVFRVSNANTAEHYEEFCGKVDCLADRFGLDHGAIDRSLVSFGGRNPEFWRKYVTEHRHSFLCA